MKVSILTVCRNSVETIEDTILSVMEQDHNDIEYIVIDGASTDGTRDIIEKYRKKISVFISEKDNGMYDALNKALGFASGEITGILNSDDFYADKKVISKVVGLFSSQTCDCVYSDLVYVDRKDTSKIVRKWKAGNYSEGLFLDGWMPPHPTFFVKTKIYRQFGTFNTTLRIAADYELMLRFIHKHNIKPCYLPETTVKMRRGGFGNVGLSARLQANREDRLAWKINELKPGLFTLWKKPFSKINQFL